MIARTLIGTVLLLAMASAHATMYKWTDENGNVQFGQFPPAGIEAERIKPARAPASQPDSAAPSLQDRVKALEERKRRERKQALKAKEEQEQAALRERNCKNARESIRMLERGGNRRYRMPDGTVKHMDENESRRRINESKKYIAENCS